MSKEQRCTCDDFCDSPCPVHWRENELQNRWLVAEATVKRLRQLLGKVKPYIVLPSAVEREETAEYLEGLHRAVEESANAETDTAAVKKVDSLCCEKEAIDNLRTENADLKSRLAKLEREKA